MFKKILIANRGEIACRVIRTAKRMGLATVAVYSEADRNAQHVQMADETVLIGPAPAGESYLAIENIVAVCLKTKADAVHPGYGFLSENADFAHALEAAGIAFIGPNPGAIKAMGDKICAKKIAKEAGVSILPGTFEAVESAGKAAEFAEKIGYPVMIKASAGGGGKGMRIARSEAEIMEGFTRASSEAASSFGDARVFIEKFIEQPRHIEIQVLADKHGHVIHLNERECSIQRRHQKIIEEAPSPFVSEEMRAEMGRQACLLAAAVDYDSAGTVEFVVAEDRGFYFLEMNTRLQVEHPVTECITGVDLVEQMIRVAANEPLALRQSDISINGWAVESRIYAEDPYRGFLPSVGRLQRFQPPDADIIKGEIRVDSGVMEGSEIQVFYDPMIAKLITHGADRPAAIQTMIQALDGFVIEGIEHNIPFLSAVMEHPRWQEGWLSTDFIAQEYPQGFTGRAPDETLSIPLAATALAQALCRESRLQHMSGRIASQKGQRQPHWSLRFGEHSFQAEICHFSAGLQGRLAVRFNSGEKAYELRWNCRPNSNLWQVWLDQTPYLIQVRPQTGGAHLSSCGISMAFRVLPAPLAGLDGLMPVKAALDTSKLLLCPMPGLVISILVKEGQTVKVGEPLAVVEAMKMENVLRAERDGAIERIHVKPGDSLAVDALIMEFS